jgi:hypothetical protein
MSGQIPDTVTWARRRYELVGIDGGPLFHPGQHGIRIATTHAACARGYVCHYGLRRTGLVLNRLQLHVPAGRGDPPLVAGAPPRGVDRAGLHEYVGLGHRVPFVGRLLLGRDFDATQYRHMGHPDWQAYRDVREATVTAAGVVVIEQTRAVVPPPAGVEDGDAAGTAWTDRGFRRHPGPAPGPGRE